MAKGKETKRNTMNHKTIHRKLKIEQQKSDRNSCAPEGYARRSIYFFNAKIR